MSRPQFSVQPLESRRMLSAHAVQEFASALGEEAQLHLAEPLALKAELGLRADPQALDRNVTELKAALADLAKLMGG